MHENVQFDKDDDDSFVIEKGLCKNFIQEHEPESDCIVNMSHFLKEMHRTFDNHARGIECQFKDWILINSRRLGFLTKIFFKCRMCNYEAYFWSHPQKDDTLNINSAAVAGTITTGIGFAQLQELHAAMNLFCMSEPTYIKYRDQIIDEFQKTAMESMKKAGELERALALERNDVINGIPYIPVVADGCWLKRTYGSGYNSASGVGAIIGYHTKKVLFLVVRNKYCSICDMAERKNIKPRTHKCYKNFDRNASSTRMKSDAIAEGFNCSLEMHNLIYKTVIADGDSSLFQTILDNAPYSKQMVTVKKIECTNHLLRNLCNKLKAVSQITQPKTHRQRGFVQVRNIVKKNILNIRREIENAAKLRRKEQKPQHCRVKELQEDILNIPSHVFGEHKRCEIRGQMWQRNKNRTEKNYVPYLKLYGLYQKIESAIFYISGYSDSLLLHLTNNPAEAFNSIVCKMIGGKRIHFGKRGSFDARSAGAAVQYNSQEILTELHRSMNKNVPPVIENLEKQRQKKIARTRESREAQGRQKKFKREPGTDSHYGPQSRKPDLPPETFEQLRQHHLEELFENAKNWKKIEFDTRQQSKSQLWLSLRRKMLTSSNFRSVCRMRQTTSCAGTVKAILYPPFIDTAAVKYGCDMEEIAKKELATKLNKLVKSCGLFIDTENPCLGTTPDGLLDENGLIEIKCPLSAENLTAEKAIKTIPSLKGIFDKKNPDKMNKNHRFFYQIQGQLNITRREYCVFALWTPKSMKMIYINRDDAFWKNQMLPFLTRFYDECMIPEILDSRHNRHVPIRDLGYIIEAKREAAKKENIRKSFRQSTLHENVANKEQETLDISCTKTEITTAMEQDDDCTYIGTSHKDVTEEDKARRQINLDEVVIPVSLVRENVLSDNMLNDESLDSFLRVIRETTQFQTQSVQYQGCLDYIDASQSNKSVQIIEGKSLWTGDGIAHWRCIFYDGTKLYVYDSIPNCKYDKLAAKEKNYIHLRYPKIKLSDIIFEKVDTQPDSTSCGIYSAAFATTIVLGGNPCNVKYSRNMKSMRQHFMKIIESNKLLAFSER
ncbi:uncharacterized protein LOC118647911 [Monomorium pharaonis]|uniref:uncharacterized protein LOC118647911 n=1 Tax=Monomorium pharaonis TaxID=307658 RepID=UPI001747269B|nr:uncharacterized protein LOC118647911 [Monomorium pharaonis]